MESLDYSILGKKVKKYSTLSSNERVNYHNNFKVVWHAFFGFEKKVRLA